MKISYNWLKEFVDFDASPKEIAERLTMVGLAVETVQTEGDDHILEFDLTSNRPDALSHYGVAREVAAIYGTTAHLPELKLSENNEQASATTSVEILNPELCPRYIARVILGVKVGPSPDWLVKRLESVGQRSINNIADITNLVMWEQGHPLHAFDFNKLAGRKIVVRTARPGEILHTLDGVERKLREDMLVIADAENASAMAGIMGGEYSEISAETQDALLECAYFNPQSIRRTARALEMNTEASYRFERGADPEACLRAINRCSELICELAGGKLLAGAVDAYPIPVKKFEVELRHSRIVALTGLQPAPERVESILLGLGFDVERMKESEKWLVKVPTHRVDVSLEEDLVEEVARHEGYDKIPLRLPIWSGVGSYLANEDRSRRVKTTLIEQGYCETITLSWVKPESDAFFHNSGTPVVMLKNPIDDERPQMRTSLLPGLLDGLLRNFNYGIRNVRLFETGICFRADKDRPREFKLLALAATGQSRESDWKMQNETIDFYEIKGAIESMLENCGIKHYNFERSKAPYLHTGQSADIIADGRSIGRLGQLAPLLREEYKFKQPVYVAEIALDEMLRLSPSEMQYVPLPKLQAVSRDISVLVSKSIDYAEMASAVRALGIKELVGVRLFDVYTGKNLPDEKRSLSFNLRYQPTAETMTDEQINRLDERIIEMLESRFEAQLRR